MRGLLRIALWLCAALVLAAVPLAAQSDFLIRAPGGTRPFADPLYWLNMTPPQRLPLREKLMLPATGSRLRAPPEGKPNPELSFWLGAGFELNAKSAGPNDSLMALTPGVRYRKQTARANLAFDYSAELVLPLPGNPRRTKLRQHGGRLSAAYALSPRSRLSLFNSFTDTTDLSDQPIAGQLTPGTRVLSNALSLGYRHSPSKRSLLDLSYSNAFHIVDTAGAPDIFENRIAGQYQFALAETASLTAYADLAHYKIGRGSSEGMAKLGAIYTRDLGPRLAISGKLGLIHLSENGGQNRLDLGMQITHTDRFARYSLALSRDILAVPGLPDLAQSDELRGDLVMRLNKGLMLEMGASVQRLRLFDAIGTQVDGLSLETRVSYALDKDFWLWAEIELNRESSAGTRSFDNSLTLGLSKRLGR